MRLHVILNATQIDPDGVKGEEFDEELTSQLENVDIEGWEIEVKAIDRVKPKDVGPIEGMLQSLSALTHRSVVEENDGPQLDQPYPANPKYTWREMVAYWVAEMRKISQPKEPT